MLKAPTLTLLVASLTVSLSLGAKSAWVGAWVGGLCLLSVLAYAYDKCAAGSRGLRVPEAVLIGLAVLGGTFGAELARQFFRHKTAKGYFGVLHALATGLMALACLA